MLRVENLNREIIDFELKDISFSLPKGYIMGLIGLNASGKTSLIKTIINIYHRDSGKVYINGLSVDEDERKAKNLMRIVLDENFYEPGLSAENNAKLFGKYFEHYDHDIFLRHCRKFNVDVKKKLKKLSKGQQMKFQIAFALSHDAKLLIMDEPTANLDQAFRMELMEIMQDFIADGERSILLATHQTDTLDQIADYITLLHKGRIVFSMSKEALMDKYCLLSGDADKINELPEDLVVYREEGLYRSMALVYKPGTGNNVMEKGFPEGFDETTESLGLIKARPTIEELMYFMVKGGFHSVETGMEGQLSY